MCIINKLNNVHLIRIEIIVIFITSVLHIVFGFVIKLSDFNINELFDSSPFFNFTLQHICSFKNDFHTWGGWKRKESNGDSTSWYYFDKTNITIINRRSFCYNYKSYRDLLNNGQIIKQGTECPKEYNKNCGRIDTLNQELCIKEKQKCPLYDIGIGQPLDLTNYEYINESNIYYSKDNYTNINKTIIAKLILNDGQPCYHPIEKLWRKFSPSEVDDTHLECTHIQVFNKYNEDRFEKKGEITYSEIYKDNLSPRAIDIIFSKNSTIGNEVVSLYKRGFYGIDKKCDEKFNLTDNYEHLQYLNKIQSTDKIIQFVQGFIIGGISIIFIIIEINSYCSQKRIFSKDFYRISFLAYIFAVGGALAYHTIVYIKIINSKDLDYNCSDSITNEIIKSGNAYNKKMMILTKVSFYIDAVFIAGNIIVFIIGLIWDIIDKCITTKSKPNEYRNVDNINNSGVSETPYYADYPADN